MEEEYPHGTATLARLFAAQGHWEKAVAIYNFLNLALYHHAYPSEPGGISALKLINAYGWGLCGGEHTVEAALWKAADVVAKVRPPTDAEAKKLRKGQTLISFFWPGQNEALLNIAKDKGATRFARDDEGNPISVPAKQTYYDWLKDQPPAFQDSVIGGVTVMPDLSFCAARLGGKAMRFAPTGFSPGGAPPKRAARRPLSSIPTSLSVTHHTEKTEPSSELNATSHAAPPPYHGRAWAGARPSRTGAAIAGGSDAAGEQRLRLFRSGLQKGKTRPRSTANPAQEARFASPKRAAP